MNADLRDYFARLPGTVAIALAPVVLIALLSMPRAWGTIRASRCSMPARRPRT